MKPVAFGYLVGGVVGITCGAAFHFIPSILGILVGSLVIDRLARDRLIP